MPDARSPSHVNTPGPKKARYDAPIVLAVRLHPDVKPALEECASAHGLRVMCVRHLQAACSALASQPIAVVLADESTRPWDREVLREHADRAGIAIVWVEAELAHDFLTDVVRMYVASRGRSPHWRSSQHAS